MVQLGVTKTRLSHSCKNLSGAEIVVTIEKQGGALNVSVSKASSAFPWGVKTLVFIMLLYSLFYYLFNTSAALICAAITAVLYLCISLGSVREETVMVVKSLGYQITTKYVLGKKSLFIPCHEVQNIFINEAILRHKVIYVLTILTKDSEGCEKLNPLFTGVMARLLQLEMIYKHFKEIAR